jgi:photosystem II stability/assembly factor-like uncharacterized protein
MIGRIVLMNFMKSIIRNFAFLLTTLLMCISQGCTKPGWVSQTSGTTNQLFGVWSTDANTGIVVGGLPDNCILLTTDAGTTWNPQSYPNMEGYFGGVCFSDSMNGWVVGFGGTILHTSNGGTTWTRQTSGASYGFETVFCLDTNTAWAVGYSIILHTTNGGATWTSQRPEITTGIWDVFFTNSETGTAVGGWCIGCIGMPFYGGYILRTTNGGAKWTIQRHDTTMIGLYGVFFTDTNTGTVVGAGGTILRTTNGGTTWTKQTSGTTNDLWDVFFTNADTGIVVGGNWNTGLEGTILRTTNGGTTWTKQEIPTTWALYRVFFTDASTGTAVGQNGTILRTTTGGEPLLKYHRD